ncbi:MAG TPA: hypothetical protein VJN18_16080 [Polyangiaceae bacterium]|nr:hypothetical protein [Polyangiaceae bacterium]
MRYVSWGGVVMGVACAIGCADPALDLPAPRDGLLDLVLEPSEADAWPLAFRGHLANATERAVPWLFRGELSDYHERALRRGELSSTLLERAVPLRFWREGAECLLQPLDWLEPGESYTLALTGHGRVRTLRAKDGPMERASRFFPPLGAPVREGTVLCGARFGELPSLITLEPGAIEARVTPGAFGASRPDCVTVVADQAFSEPVVAPPLLGGVLLEPGSFTPDSNPVSKDSACSAGQLVADACVEVEDDRIFITALDDSLWLLQQPSEIQLPAPALQRVALLRGLAPETELELVGHVISSAGGVTPLDMTVTTKPRRRHLVLNEVLANALGPEPDSEWIEVVNDSEHVAELSGVWLEDGGGRVPLPVEVLQGREIVLLVAASSRESSVDVTAAPRTRRLELPSLGERGLSNSGELLQLIGPEGVLSRFPMLPAPHAGRSLARRSLDTADDDPRSFGEHAPPGASPGALNSLE